VTLRLELCSYGEPALLRLRLFIDEAKRDDPFAPVTVVVPRGIVGLGVRRALAAYVSPTGRRGVANVSFVTLAGLADSVAAGVLAAQGRSPLTDALLRAAIRDALATVGGPLLGPTRDHPSTIDALLLTYRELRDVDEETMVRLKSHSARAGEVIAVLGEVRRSTSQWFDGVDVFTAATDCLSAPVPGGMIPAGPVVLYLPMALASPAVRFFRALAERLSCTVMVGLTGDPLGDELAHQLIESLQPGHRPDRPDSVEIPAADAVLSAPTSDAEVLLVLRDVMERCSRGTPLEQMAIAHAGSPQYVNLLYNSLRQAGIPFNGGGSRPLSSTVAGRTLLGALQLPDHDWRREEVAEWLHTGPIVHRGKAIPSTRWDVLSAESGVTGGLNEWGRVLRARAEMLRTEAEHGRPEDDDELWRGAMLVEASRCGELLDFLTTVATTLSEAPTTWGSWAKWAKAFLRTLVGGPGVVDQWPAEERAAATAVDEAIDRLAHIELLGTPCTPAAAKVAFLAEMAEPAPQTTRFGIGVLVAPISSVVGLTCEVLYVVGMNDGIFPGRPTDDVLIPDRERIDAQGEGTIALRGTRAITLRRDYLAALAGAATRLLSYPRGNQRDGRELRPSRWVLDAVGTLADSEERLYSGDLDAIPSSSYFRKEPSYMASVRAAGVALSLEDRDLRSLVEWTNSGRSLASHFLSQHGPLASGVQLVGGRRNGFTRFNGNIGREDSRDPLIFSATRLETFARCPRRYFFESVLNVVPRPVSEHLLSTDRMEYGSLVHRILEQYVKPQKGRPPEQGPDNPFTPERLLTIANDVLDQFERDGLAGPGASWQVERIRLLRELRTFAVKDLEWRREHGIVTTGVEERFGPDLSHPVVVDRPGRQPVSFRGSIDRIDEDAHGARFVIDYKTGSSRRYKDIAQDHYQQGSAVQLPVYGLAAGADETRSVRSEYWCVSERGEFERFGFDVTPAEVVELGKVVDVLSEAMERGQYPANPGTPGSHRDGQCTFCPYDSVCPTDRQKVWDRVKRDPALTRLSELVESS
jgi:ATP-dependent helicase/nuclease subunit B